MALIRGRRRDAAGDSNSGNSADGPREHSGRGHVSEIVRELGELLPAEALVGGPGRLLFASDGGVGHRHAPAAVVLPRSERELARALRFCHENGLDAVLRGAGTSVSGGAVGASDSVVVATTRLNRIIELDRRDRRVRAEAGAMLTQVAAAAAEAGLMLPQAPRTPSPATLGGAIAKDTSGSAGARYGSIASRVAGLRLVLCDGEILELGEGELDCGGYDIAGLVAGSEGVLAAISEATLALLPATGPAHLLVAEFADTVSAAQAAIGLVSDDFSPAALELVDRSVLAASGAPFEGAGDGRGGAFLLVEIDGGHQDPEPGVARARDRLAGFGARRVDQTGDRALEQRIWRARETASARLARRGSTGHCDLTLPIGHLADFLVRLDEIASASGVAVVHLARPGEGRIESVFIARDDSADGAARVATAVDQADGLAADWGGLTIGEGGAGVVRAVGGGAADLAVQQRLKTVFDGNWTMNRGKVLPGGG